MEEPGPNGAEQAPKRRRVAQDAAGALNDELEANPRDVVAWRKLIAEYKTNDRLTELAEVYERMLVLYPLSGEIWRDYIELTLQQSDFPQAEKLFARSLTKVPSVGVWDAYIGYIRRVNPINTGVADTTRAYTVIAQAYEFALGKVQYDAQSGGLWRDYIDFLQSRPAETTWDQQQRMDEVRKTYRRAVSLPLANVEALWRGYNAFENEVSRATARKFIDERSNAYMSARSAFQKLSTMNSGIDHTTLPGARQYSSPELDQLRLWRQLITLEKSDVLGLQDPETVRSRVIYTYRQASVSLCMFPEIWFDIAEYTLANGLSAEAADFLRQGLDINQGSFLLTTRLGQVFETEDRLSDMTETYHSLISHLKHKLAAIPAPSGTETDAMEGRAREEVAREITLAYTELMRATKRRHGVKEARKVSSECRKLPYCTFEIYTASAGLELQNKDTVIAGKIYELAYKKYREVPGFLMAYLKFLFQIGDDTNARVVFEKAATDLSPVAVRPLFDQFLEFEATLGDFAALLKLESRYTATYPDADPVELYGRRYKHYGADPVGRELHLDAVVTPKLSIPASVVALLDKLPPESFYDGPVIQLERLVDLLVQYA